MSVRIAVDGKAVCETLTKGGHDVVRFGRIEEDEGFRRLMFAQPVCTPQRTFSG
jgi:hypothetical protein